MTSSLRPYSAMPLLASALAFAVAPGIAYAEDSDVEADQSSRTIIVTGQRAVDSNPNANPDAPYKVEKSANDKFTEDLRDTPKSVTVIPKEVIEDIGATSFREVARSTPGVTLGTGEGGNAFGDRIFIRGFEARNDVYIDGLRDPGVSSREIFAVEQIEIIKGPSGSFGGRGTTGGLVSLQSKRPSIGKNFAVVEGTIGTENHYRATIDANVALTDGLALRVNTVYHSADTPGRDFVEAERKGTAAALAWNPINGLLLTADYYHFRLDGIPDFGHPFDIVTQRPYKVDRDNYYGVIGRDFLYNGADIGTFAIEYDPIDALSLRSVTRYGKTYNRYLVGTPGAVCRVARTAALACPAGGTNAPPTGVAVPESQFTIGAGGQRRYSDTRYLASLADATIRLGDEGFSHTIVVGGEYARERVDAFRLLTSAFVEDASGNVTSVSPFIRNLLDPNPVLNGTIASFVNGITGPTKTRVESAGLYLIDTVKLGPKFSLTLGARYDAYDIELFNPDASNAPGLQPESLANNASFLNWQASALYKPVEALSLYASYSTSSNPSGEQIDGNGIAYDGLAAVTQNLSPERNENWEAGVKGELFGGELLLTGAVFQITKSNAREQTAPGVYELVGKLRSRGAELGISGNVGERIQIFGGYTYTDAKLVESVIAANEGKPFANIPKHSASLLVTFSVTDRFQIGGQAHYQSKFFGGNQVAGTSNVPGYARFDAVARWKPMEWLEARVNVLNLTDKVYYDAIYRSASPFAYVAPGRSATFSLTASF
jgi:catecholate siderophore receptor